MKLRTLAWTVASITLFAAACQRDVSTVDESPPALTPEEMSQALSAVGRLNGPLARMRGLSTALDRVDAANFEAARKAIEREIWWFGDVEVELFLEAWTRIDPGAAFAFATRWPDAAMRPKAMAAVVQAWALADPEQAAIEAERLSRKYPAIETLFVENLVKGWAQSGKPGLLAFAAKGSEAYFPAVATQVVGIQLRRLGVSAVLEWADAALAEDLPHKLRLNLCRRVAGLVGRLDPVATAKWLAPHAEAPYAEGAKRLLTERWVAIDAEAAIDWATETYPAAAQKTLLPSGFSKWLARDFESATDFIRATPPEARYDAARSSLAINLAHREPEEAVSWASQIVDADLRASTLERAASSWYQRDPIAAETWLQTSDLDESARTTVRRAPERRRLRPLDR